MLHDIFSMKKYFVILSNKKKIAASTNAMTEKKRNHIRAFCKVDFFLIFCTFISIGILYFVDLLLRTTFYDR